MITYAMDRLNFKNLQAIVWMMENLVEILKISHENDRGLEHFLNPFINEFK